MSDADPTPSPTPHHEYTFKFIKWGLDECEVCGKGWSERIHKVADPTPEPSPGTDEIAEQGVDESVSRFIGRLHEQIRTLTAQVAELQERDQRWVDQVCHYRNLAIMLRAKPNMMLHDSDRRLCEDWQANPEKYNRDDDRDFRDDVAEVADIWEQNETLTVQVEKLQRERDDDQNTILRFNNLLDNAQKDRDEALAELGRLRPVVEAAKASYKHMTVDSAGVAPDEAKLIAALDRLEDNQ